jgi:3-hydroxybutyryl-CoA dehydrogenase
VPVIGLVVIVRALDTSDETIEKAHMFAERLGKQAIETKDRSGFIVNFLLIPYLMAAVRMYEDGFASREDIDEGMKLGCGHPMGPLTLCDFMGLDVLYAVCNSLYEEFKRDEYRSPTPGEAHDCRGASGQEVRPGLLWLPGTGLNSYP